MRKSCYILGIIFIMNLFASEPCTQKSLNQSIKKVCQNSFYNIQLLSHMNFALKLSNNNQPKQSLEHQDAINIAQNILYKCSQLKTCPSICKGSECDFCKRCSDYNIKTKKKLGHNWTQTDYIRFANQTDENGKFLRCSSYVYSIIEHNTTQTTIRKLLSSKDGTIIYDLPKTECSPSKYQIKRRLTLSEHGVLVVDYSSKVKQFPGIFLLTKKKRSITYKTSPDGNLNLKMTGGIQFSVHPNGNIDSNLLKSEMFNQKTCSSRIVTERGKLRSYPNMQYKTGAKKRFIDKSILQFGSVAEEKSLNKRVEKLQREKLL